MAAAPKPGKQSLSGPNVILGVTLISLLVAGFYGYRYLAPNEAKNPHNQPAPTSQSAQVPAFDQNHYQHLREKAEKNPGNFKDNLDLANFLFDSQRFSEALSYYQKAIQIDSKVPDVLVDAGVCHFNLNQFSEAKSFFVKAIDIDSRHINALYNLGVVSAQLGEMPDMIKYWEKLIEVAPQTQQAQNARQMLDQTRQSGSANN